MGKINPNIPTGHSFTFMNKQLINVVYALVSFHKIVNAAADVFEKSIAADSTDDEDLKQTKFASLLEGVVLYTKYLKYK